ncbi:MAG: hypothetical protein NT011_03115 [Kiritimatiellaeota bacterium]|nr:hypothetical protein [Kiritimatiellota bacterium]
MLLATLQAVRSILTADPSVNPPERNRLLSLMRRGPEAQANPTIAAPIFTEIIRRELVPIMEGVKNIVEIVRAEKTEKGELKKENAELRKANQATSEEFQESVRQFVKELQYPLSAIYELRWNRHLSQAKIVAECRRLKITGCRRKKRVGELLAEIITKAKNKGYMLADRITGPGAPPDMPTGYDEAIDGKAKIETNTPAAIMDKAEMDSLIKTYRKASPAEQVTLREYYGPAFVKELNRRAPMPE